MCAVVSLRYIRKNANATDKTLIDNKLKELHKTGQKFNENCVCHVISDFPHIRIKDKEPNSAEPFPIDTEKINKGFEGCEPKSIFDEEYKVLIWETDRMENEKELETFFKEDIKPSFEYWPERCTCRKRGREQYSGSTGRYKK